MSRKNSNKGPASDKIDSISEDLNQSDGVPATDQADTPNQAEEQPAPPPIDSPEDVDDQSGVEPAPGQEQTEDEDDEEEEIPAEPTQTGSTQRKSEEGMGFPRKNGKTVDIFDGKTPHETVKNVAGVMVPLTNENYNTKTDAEIIAKLKDLGKL